MLLFGFLVNGGVELQVPPGGERRLAYAALERFLTRMGGEVLPEAGLCVKSLVARVAE